ncbi:MAG: metallophosphatase domain-containing protein [Granulosicoccus sp.]
MKLVCISDTHGDHEGLELPDGDVLIHAGDLSAHGRRSETLDFMKWLGSRGFDNTLCIAGNHDTFMEEEPLATQQFAEDNGVLLLNDSGCQLGGLQFWGSPITPRFLHWSFMRDAGEDIEAHWNQIPLNTDVLITHGPPYDIMDQVRRSDGQFEKTGCPSLLERVKLVSPSVHIFGHIHEGRGTHSEDGITFHNVSTMNEFYQRTYLPVVIELP